MSRSGTVDAGILHDCVNHVQEIVNAVFRVNKDPLPRLLQTRRYVVYHQ